MVVHAKSWRQHFRVAFIESFQHISNHIHEILLFEAGIDASFEKITTVILQVPKHLQSHVPLAVLAHSCSQGNQIGYSKIDMLLQSIAWA